MNHAMNDLLLGAIAMGSIVASIFFLRFWHSTRDRFFLYFSLSFLVEGLNRILLGSDGGLTESSPAYYVIRLLSYGLILWAIIEKNKPDVKDKEPD